MMKWNSEMKKINFNGLFAFIWSDLSENIQEKISRKIRQMYGPDISDKDVESIFKCLVARDIEIPIPYIKIEDEPAIDGVFPMKVYDNLNRCRGIEYKHIVQPSRKAYFVYDYISQRKQYKMLKARNSSLLAFDDYDAVMYDYNDAVELCEECATKNLLQYICFGWSFSEEKISESWKKFFKRIENRDWTKIGTVLLKKSDFMENPIDLNKAYLSRLPDCRLKDLIEKYHLSVETNQLFIDWVAGGCKGSINGKTTIKLTEENNCSFAVGYLRTVSRIRSHNSI